MRAILDPDLSAGDADRVHEALQAGGGCLAKGAYLGTKATHVICHPEAAPRWMAMGISIVSPQWILRSLEQGSQQRCFQMSLDALRRLPGSSTAPSAHPAGISIGGSQTPGEAGGASNGGQNRDGGVGDPADSRSEPELAARLDSREARAALLASMHAAASDQQTGLLPAAQEDLILDTPEAKDDQADELMSATQQTVDAICDAAGGQPGSGERTPCGSGARKLSEEAWEEPIYKAPSLTLLLPLDRKGECGHETRTLAVASKGLTRRALLHHIFQFYQEPMSIQEQMRVMQRGGHAGKLVQAAFVDMKPLRRGALLESRCHLEGLTRVSRERTATIYELSLGS
ncbi:hypothetical protein WJX72_003160 [[Myrmecia] bisecta]|uniref:BRCT domain-containing protein n=1 Tax=[Myrmecia] bisecta TaxID=41462 RepID=A0AAW1PTV6_9CHLO